MATFTLPKLKWLLAGAIAAGFWAVTQEPPSSRHADRPAKAVERTASAPKAKQTAAAKPRQETIESLITSSIPRPESPVGMRAKPRLMHTTDKVRLREKASTKSAVVTMLKGGQPVSVLATDGVWNQVSVAGNKGWVHGDYLTAQPPRSAKPLPRAGATVLRTEDIPRPKELVSARPAARESAPKPESSREPSGGFLWGAMRPVRPPQGGDCQCPYDLMLSGKQCGDHSAFARNNGEGVQCYF